MGNFEFTPDFIPPEDASRLFAILLRETPWCQHTGGFGKKRPRLESWHGDAGVVYTSYNRGMQPVPWTPTLLEIKEMVERKTRFGFNGVLLNLYRDQNDSVSKHSDDEPEFGTNPTIASISLGETRRFIVRGKQSKSKRAFMLTSGSLLVMSGDSQSAYIHEIPKEKSPCGSRINLTFRKIIEAV
jgi:alkylated DNA repair dioxygenase AlkB